MTLNGTIVVPNCQILVTEMAHCDLFKIINVHGPLDEQLALSMLRDLIKGVQAMHNSGFVHLDLKPQNILVSRENKLIIADLGLTSPIVGDDSQGNFNSGSRGTISYQAPEFHSSKSFNGVKVDTFALGVILFNMLTGRAPFFKADENDKCYQLFMSNPDLYF